MKLKHQCCFERATGPRPPHFNEGVQESTRNQKEEVLWASPGLAHSRPCAVCTVNDVVCILLYVVLTLRCDSPIASAWMHARTTGSLDVRLCITTHMHSFSLTVAFKRKQCIRNNSRDLSFLDLVRCFQSEQR